MPKPCTGCRNAKVPQGEERPKCIVDVRHGQCSECARKGYVTCDVSVSWTEWERLRDQRRQLKRKLEEAEELATEARSALIEREAKVHRLRKQLRLAEDREDEAIRADLSALREVPVPPSSPSPSDFLLEPDLSSLGESLELPPLTWAEFSEMPDFFVDPSSVGCSASAGDNPTVEASSSNQEAAV